MLNIGDTTINKAYLGDTEIKKGYLGDSLLFDFTGDGYGTFDGVNDRVVIPTAVSLTDFDISWKFSTTDTGNQILMGDDHTNSYYFNIFFGNYVNIFRQGAQVTFILLAGNNFADGNPHTLRYTYDSTSFEVKCYFDDVLQGTKLMTAFTGGNDFVIGDSNRAHSFFEGEMFHTIIKDGDGGTVLRQYDFEETSGTSVNDASSNNDHGVLGGDDGSNFWAGNN